MVAGAQLSPPAPPHRVPVGRAIAFFTLLALMWGAPFMRHVVKARNPVFQGWGMFGSAGLSATQVEFRHRHADGSGDVIDRYALLVPPGEVPPRTLRRLKDVQAVRHVGRALCGALGPDAHVVAQFRIATRSGWKTVMAGEENLCAP